MMLTKTFFAVFILVSSSAVFGQDFEVPKNYQFETVEAINSYEQDVLKAINWLESTPINTNPAKRKEANAFVMSWMMVTPSVKIELQAYITELTKKNSDLLMPFLGGWTRYTLENPSEINNTLANNIKGVESLLKVYADNLGNGIKKDKKVENLLKLSDQELEDWVKSNL